MVGFGENFQNGGTNMTGKCNLRLAFTNTVFDRRAMLLRFYAEHTGSVLDILSYPERTMRPPWLGPEKVFSK